MRDACWSRGTLLVGAPRAPRPSSCVLPAHPRCGGGAGAEGDGGRDRHNHRRRDRPPLPRRDPFSSCFSQLARLAPAAALYRRRGELAAASPAGRGGLPRRRARCRPPPGRGAAGVCWRGGGPAAGVRALCRRALHRRQIRVAASPSVQSPAERTSRPPPRCGPPAARPDAARTQRGCRRPSGRARRQGGDMHRRGVREGVRGRLQRPQERQWHRQARGGGG